MTKAELLDLIARFSREPVPALVGRHVYLWHGTWKDLERIIAAETVVHLDLHELAATLERTPRAEREARRLLRRSLQKALISQFAPGRQQVFVVTGCDFLSRYQVSSTPFFEIASESQMVILTLSPDESGFQPAGPLPDYVSLDATAPLAYLRNAVGSASVVNATEDVT